MSPTRFCCRFTHVCSLHCLIEREPHRYVCTRSAPAHDIIFFSPTVLSLPICLWTASHWNIIFRAVGWQMRRCHAPSRILINTARAHVRHSLGWQRIWWIWIGARLQLRLFDVVLHNYDRLHVWMERVKFSLEIFTVYCCFMIYISLFWFIVLT